MYTHPHPSVLVVAVVCIVMFAALGTEPERRGSAGYSVWRRRRCHPIIPHNASGTPSISSDRYDYGGDGTIPHGEQNEHTVPRTHSVGTEENGDGIGRASYSQYVTSRRRRVDCKPHFDARCDNVSIYFCSVLGAAFPTALSTSKLVSK